MPKEDNFYKSIKTVKINWTDCYRIIPSRYPPKNLFNRVADDKDLNEIIAVENLTNDRLRNQTGTINLIHPEMMASGPGSNYINAAFTHLSPNGSRFTNGDWGVYYAAKDIETVIAETKHHREKFMRATNQKPQQLEMRVLTTQIKAELHDITELDDPEIYDHDNYYQSQKLAKYLKKNDSDGILYRSIRHDGGINVAIFKAKLISNCKQERHLAYCWNGKIIDNIFEMRDIKKLRIV